VCHGDLWTGNLMYKDDYSCAPKEYHCAAYLRQGLYGVQVPLCCLSRARIVRKTTVLPISGKDYMEYITTVLPISGKDCKENHCAAYLGQGL
jgi:hypothetical protein